MTAPHKSAERNAEKSVDITATVKEFSGCWEQSQEPAREPRNNRQMTGTRVVSHPQTMREGYNKAGQKESWLGDFFARANTMER
jgi:hypothetical protein